MTDPRLRASTCPLDRLARSLRSSKHPRLAADDQRLAVEVLGRLPQLHDHFEHCFASTNEATHLSLSFQRHLELAADCSKVIRLQAGQQYCLPPRSQLHLLLRGTPSSPEPLFVFAKKPLPKVAPDEHSHLPRNVQAARQQIVSLAQTLGLEHSGLARRIRDSEDSEYSEEVMAVFSILFFPPGTESRIDLQHGSAPVFPLGTADPELLKAVFATSIAQADGSTLDYIYKGQLQYQPVHRLPVGTELGSLSRSRPKYALASHPQLAHLPAFE